MGAERLTARNFYHGKPVVMPNFPGNFRKGKMPQNALFPKEFPETLVQAKCYPWGLVGSVGIFTRFKIGGVPSVSLSKLTKQSWFY